VNSPEAWRQFFHANDICWVVRAPDYLAAIAPSLQSLEAQGQLQPFASGEVNDFAGMRIFDMRTTVPVFILRTKP
jgi:hypothetical protein